VIAPEFELDPERALWRPTRRFFLMGLGAAIVAPALPEPFVMDPDRVYFTPGGSDMRVVSWPRAGLKKLNADPVFGEWYEIDGKWRCDMSIKVRLENTIHYAGRIFS